MKTIIFKIFKKLEFAVSFLVYCSVSFASAIVFELYGSNNGMFENFISKLSLDWSLLGIFEQPRFAIAYTFTLTILWLLSTYLNPFRVLTKNQGKEAGLMALSFPLITLIVSMSLKLSGTMLENSYLLAVTIATPLLLGYLGGMAQYAIQRIVVVLFALLLLGGLLSHAVSVHTTEYYLLPITVVSMVLLPVLSFLGFYQRYGSWWMKFSRDPY